MYSFKDLMMVDYRPGEPEEMKYYNQKQKKIYNGNEEVEADEALNMQQRRAASRRMKRMKHRIKIGRDKAKRRMADPARLKRRAQKQARAQILKKLTKGMAKGDLTFARRQELEKRLDKPAMKNRIARLAKKMLPKARKAELDRRRGGGSADK